MNSIVYIQRQINRILRLLLYSRAYIDDIVSGTRSFTKHLSNLRNLFRTLVEANVLISPRKVFLGYPDIKLLGQHVNSMGLLASVDKLYAISLLEYPSTLGALEHYLGLINYLRNYIYYYNAFAKPLQDLKTSILRGVVGNRKSYVSRIKLPLPTLSEQASFNSIQDILLQPDWLVYFSAEKLI